MEVIIKFLKVYVKYWKKNYKLKRGSKQKNKNNISV